MILRDGLTLCVLMMIVIVTMTMMMISGVCMFRRVTVMFLCNEGDGVAAVAAASMLRFNAGGHINHSIFWQNLAAQSKCGEPSGNKVTSLSCLEVAK